MTQTVKQWVARTLVAAIVVVGMPVPVMAQITPTYTFSPNTVIQSAQVNANFNLLLNAVNRNGGTMLATLNTRSLIPTLTNTYDLGSSGLTFRDFYLGRNATIGGTLAVTGAATFGAVTITGLTCTGCVDAAQLAATAVTAAAYGGANSIATFTVDADGRLTAAANVTPQIPISTGVTGLGTGVPAALAVNIGTSGAFVTWGSSPTFGTVTAALTGNASTATLASTVTVVDTTSATVSIAMFDAATGSLAAKTDAGLTYNATTGMLTATGFTGPLTGNVTGNVSGSSGSTTGNAATATALQTARAINGVNFDGTAAITVQVPVATGITGLGTGIAPALAVNVGSAGAPVLFDGALGTPSSGTGTNLTGIPETAITDGTILARLAANETVTGVWTFDTDMVVGAVGGGNGIQFLAPSSVNVTLQGGTDNWYAYDNANARYVLRYVPSTNAMSTPATWAFGGGPAISSSSNVALLDAANVFTANLQTITANASAAALKIIGRATGGQEAIVEWFANDGTTSYGSAYATSSGPLLRSPDATSTLQVTNTGTTVNELLTVSGFGTHSFSAGGTGTNTFRVRNTTAGTGNYADISVGNDLNATAGYLLVTSSTWTSTGALVQNAAILQSEQAGGLSLSASHASGDLRAYSRGALALTLGASQAATFAGTITGSVSGSTFTTDLKVLGAEAGAATLYLWADGPTIAAADKWDFTAADGSTLTLTGGDTGNSFHIGFTGATSNAFSVTKQILEIQGGEGESGEIDISADDGDDTADVWVLRSETTGVMNFFNLGTGTLNILEAVSMSSSLTVTTLASASGTRYICSDTAGLFSASASACSGTDADAIASIPQLWSIIADLRAEVASLRAGGTR